MNRINRETVELTDTECVIAEIVELLMDQGVSAANAVFLITGAGIPLGLRTATPKLDSIMTPEFREWLMN